GGRCEWRACPGQTGTSPQACMARRAVVDNRLQECLGLETGDARTEPTVPVQISVFTAAGIAGAVSSSPRQNEGEYRAAAGMSLSSAPHQRRPEVPACSAEGGKAMAIRCLLRSSCWSVGLMGCLLLAAGHSALAAAKPHAPLKARAAHRWAFPRVTSRTTQVGKASWYGPGHQGKKTATGQRFDQQQLTAAHRTLPLGTRAKVTNLETGQAVQVTINDRGPQARGRIIDLSRAAAQRIGLKKDGTTRVRVEAS